MLLVTAIATTIASLLVFSIQRHVHLSDKSWSASTEDGRSKEEVSTTQDTRYILYGEGVSSQHTTRQLLRYILALTSRPAAGGIHLNEQSAGRQDFSERGHSEFVDKLLKGRRGGVFLECGAGDGESTVVSPEISAGKFPEICSDISGNFHLELMG